MSVSKNDCVIGGDDDDDLNVSNYCVFSLVLISSLMLSFWLYIL
jgi:hypothetical protein